MRDAAGGGGLEPAAAHGVTLQPGSRGGWVGEAGLQPGGGGSGEEPSTAAADGLVTAGSSSSSSSELHRFHERCGGGSEWIAVDRCGSGTPPAKGRGGAS